MWITPGGVRQLKFQVGGRDAFGNPSALVPEDVRLARIPGGALTDVKVTQSSSPLLVEVSAIIASEGLQATNLSVCLFVCFDPARLIVSQLQQLMCHLI